MADTADREHKTIKAVLAGTGDLRRQAERRRMDLQVQDGDRQQARECKARRQMWPRQREVAQQATATQTQIASTMHSACNRCSQRSRAAAVVQPALLLAEHLPIQQRLLREARPRRSRSLPSLPMTAAAVQPVRRGCPRASRPCCKWPRSKARNSSRSRQRRAHMLFILRCIVLSQGNIKQQEATRAIHRLENTLIALIELHGLIS